MQLAALVPGYSCALSSSVFPGPARQVGFRCDSVQPTCCFRGRSAFPVVSWLYGFTAAGLFTIGGAFLKNAFASTYATAA